MGSLALWGGVAGLGKGIMLHAEDQGKDEDFKRQELKDARMQLLAHEYRTQEQGTQGGIELANTVLAGTNAANVANIHETGENARSDKALGANKEIAATHERGAAERTRISAQARVEAAQISGAAREAASKNSKKGPRWTYQKLNLGSSIVNGVMVPGAQVPVLTDNENHSQYVQVGQDQYLPWTAGDDIPKTGGHRRAAATEVSKLLQNPAQVDNFIKTYGYLPKAWVERAMQPSAPGGLENAQPAGPAYSFSTGSEDQSDNGSADDGSEE